MKSSASLSTGKRFKETAIKRLKVRRENVIDMEIFLPLGAAAAVAGIPNGRLPHFFNNPHTTFLILLARLLTPALVRTFFIFIATLPVRLRTLPLLNHLNRPSGKTSPLIPVPRRLIKKYINTAKISPNKGSIQPKLFYFILGGYFSLTQGKSF